MQRALAGVRVERERILMSCTKCPCPDICLQREDLCHLAAQDPNEVSLRHICARSAMDRGVSMPSVVTQATNLAHSLWDWATSGFKMASEEEQARRLGICADCQHWVASSRRCSVCGCLLAYKVQMKSEHCPLAEPKW